MKVHHVAVMAMLLGTGWSTNVVYEYKTGQSLWRGVASEEVVITIDNVVAKTDELSSKITELNTRSAVIVDKSKAEDVTLSQLIELRDNDIKAVSEDSSAIWKLLNALESFTSENEGEVVAETSTKLEALKKELQSHGGKFGPDFYNLEENIKKQIEEKTIAQQQTLDDLSSNICEQNRTLSSLTSKIEELLKDKKKVVDAADEEDEENEEDEEKDDEAQARLERQMALMKAFSSNFMMSPSAFFNASAPVGLQSETNPLGVDMNFMMMANMLTGSNGFGPRANINYAPVYNQQRSYFGMPSMTNFGRDAILGNTLLDGQAMNSQGIDPVYLRAIQGNLNAENGAIFSRGNGLQGAYEF